VPAIQADGYRRAAALSHPDGIGQDLRGGHQRTEQPPVNAKAATLTVLPTAPSAPRQRRLRLIIAAAAGHALQFVAAPSGHGPWASSFPHSTPRSTTCRPRFQAGFQADSKGTPAAAR
jgi:hypothetical protein